MQSPPAVRVGQRLVGPDHPVYVIAEAGVNHDGRLDIALELIDAAAGAGADAVKFQYFSAERLAAPDAPTCQYQKDHYAGASSQLEMLRRLELPPDDFKRLKVHADQAGIDFLCTPFGIPELRALSGLEVAAIKIASPDIINIPLLREAAAAKLPVIASTGAAELDEVRAAVDLLHEHDALERLILLHCVSAYPTPPSEARLRCISTLANEFNVPVGYSDHTAEADFSALAVAAGAVILEKHLTHDRSAPGPDHFFSLTPDDFAKYCMAAKAAFSARGTGVVAPGSREAEVRKLARGSIVAARHIPAGTPISPDALTVRRPGTGIPPAEWDNVIGAVASADIPAGSPLEWAHLRRISPSSSRHASSDRITLR